MDRRSPSHGMSPHSSSTSLTSFLGGGNNAGNSPNAVTAGLMSMSLSPPSQHQHQGNNASSIAIRHEIQRFESVHPSIYAIYDLIELVPDPLLAQQIREHVVCIEDSFVNSQEWTISRGVPDIRLGIVGSLSSGKSALVHRYLTGSYMQEESPEGGRFKKEVVVDGHSYLLLIRDEGGPPEHQFTSWVDAVIFVFSLENEASFNAIYNYYVKMSQFRNMQEIPLILVGTQDAISESQPRIVDDARARKLANDLKRCAYYETCATYGLNVERVFQDACQKLTQSRSHASRPTTPRTPYSPTAATANNGYHHSHHKENRPPTVHMMTPGTYHYPMYHDDGSYAIKSTNPRGIMVPPPMPPPAAGLIGSNNVGTLSSTNEFAVPQGVPPTPSGHEDRGKDLPTPSSTPTSARKNRRRSNLFTPSKKQQQQQNEETKEQNGVTGSSAGQLGSGRSIPVKQGLLYKKSSNSFSKDWKKKYVTLCDDGRMTYHPSLNDYMSNIHGKEIPLQYVTVKVPGQKPRGSRTVPQPPNPLVSSSADFASGMSGSCAKNLVPNSAPFKNEKVLLTGYEVLRDGTGGDPFPENNHADNNEKATTTPNVKKRHHRRIKSNGIKTSSTSVNDNNNGGSADDSGGSCQGGGGSGTGTTTTTTTDNNNLELHIVSLDNKQWHFEATSTEERDEWVAAIEQQILNSLQGIESSKAKGGHSSSVMDLQAMKAIKSDVAGNDKCVDCEAPNPDWASINLGVLICIECSGVHRKLGSHISRVRSLDLDEWPSGHLAVMTSLGNRAANAIWEARIAPCRKPGPSSSQEEKERFILSKYNNREFLEPISMTGKSNAACLVDAICRSDVKAVSLALAHCSAEDVNSPMSPRDDRSPLHIASSLGNLAIAQLLLWSNANAKSIDHDGRTCVSYARTSGNGPCADLVELLLNNGCPDVTLSGTLPRRKNSTNCRKIEVMEKVTSSIL